MDRGRVAERDGKARLASNVSERHIFVRPEYDIVLDGSEIGPTGPLVIARLKPKHATTGTLPEFVLRWDEKDNHLDVDPVSVSKADANRFRQGAGDCYGHHAVKLPSAPRVFGVKVVWHGRLLYHGEIGFSLAREVESRTAIGLSTLVSESSSKAKD